MDQSLQSEPVLATIVESFPALDHAPRETPVAHAGDETPVSVAEHAIPAAIAEPVAQPLAEPVVAVVVPTEVPAAEPVAEPVAVAPLASVPQDMAQALERRLMALEQSLGQMHELESRIAARVLNQIPTAAAPKDPWYKKIYPFRRPTIPMPSGWLIVDLLNELRLTLPMIFDAGFAMTWTSRGVIVVCLLIALTSHIWLAPLGLLPVVGATIQMLLDKCLLIFLGGVLFKILHREMQRYRIYLENPRT